MSSEIEIYEDEQISLYFEIKAKETWLYVRNERNEEGPIIRSKALSTHDLDIMIQALNDMRNHMITQGEDHYSQAVLA